MARLRRPASKRLELTHQRFLHGATALLATPSPTRVYAAGGSIKIGIVTPHTGPLAVFGERTLSS